jgi:hypothetical protein
VRDRSPGGDQLIPNLSREPKVGMAVVVDMPDLPTAESGASDGESPSVGGLLTWTTIELLDCDSFALIATSTKLLTGSERL